MTTRWLSRLAAFSLWALAGWSATFWLLKVIGVSEAPVTASAIGADTPALDVQDLARAFGPAATAEPATVAAALPIPAQDPGASMRLLGVVAGRTSGGVALIAIDGQPPRPYRVGSQVDANHKLTRVAVRSATLSPTQPDGQRITLELPSAAAEGPPLTVPWGGPAARNRPPALAPYAPAPAANSTVVAPAQGTDEPPKD